MLHGRANISLREREVDNWRDLLSSWFTPAVLSEIALGARYVVMIHHLGSSTYEASTIGRFGGSPTSGDPRDTPTSGRIVEAGEGSTEGCVSFVEGRALVKLLPPLVVSRWTGGDLVIVEAVQALCPDALIARWWMDETDRHVYERMQRPEMDYRVGGDHDRIRW